MKKQAENTEIIKDIISGVDYFKEFPKSLSSPLQKIIHHLSFSGGAVYMLDESGKEFHQICYFHFPEKLLASLSVMPRDEGFAGLSVKTEESQCLTVDKYPSYLPHKSLFAEVKIHTIASIPLIFLEKVVGLMLLVSRKSLEGCEKFVGIFSIIAREFGAAIVNAKRNEQLHQSLEKQQRLIELLPDAIYQRLPDGRFLFVSPAIENITGYKQDDFYRNKSLWLNIVHPDDKKQLLSLSVSLHDAPDRFVNEYRILPKGRAEYRWIRDSVLLIRDESRVVVSIHGVLGDISAYRKNAEEQHEHIDRL